MKRIMVVLMAISLMATAIPALAEDAHQHGSSHSAQNEQCTKECDMLLKSCASEVDSIQQSIQKLQAEINDKGTTKHTLEELKALNKRLKEANETLRVLSKPH